MEHKGILKIIVKKEGHILLYAVDDNGKGRKPNNTNRGRNKQSLGIKITKDRIDILNKKKRIHGSLKIIDKKVGTRVEVRLPIEKEFNYD
jgi:LytS/YehU family sensor histidine kinase